VEIFSKDLFYVLFFFKLHMNCLYKQLIDLTAIDILTQKERFYLFYFLLSHHFNSRLIIKIKISEEEDVFSTTSIYLSANWLEREVWDLFGIYFSGHTDLRRILTDYGFEGNPLRKDFPMSGYEELYYDEAVQHIIYVPVQLAQEYREFSINNNWPLMKRSKKFKV
jgi:NADH:ubiquinone oxidoreductase subunit C